VPMIFPFVFLVPGLLAIEGEARAPNGLNADLLRVRVEISPGSRFAGQAFEIEVGVVANDERPKIELPVIAGARLWPIDTDLRPLAASTIGNVTASQNLFLNRFRVVADRPGTLQIPPIIARVDRRSGRSAPKRVEIRAVPLEGRPAEFLGGVGPFALKAEAAPAVIRLGQEFQYRITVTGPGAWGATGRPDLAGIQRLGTALRVNPEPDEAINEPPSRGFGYRIRPKQAGEFIIPPVPIAAFDPAIKRYVTKVTPSVTIRVLETPSFNPASIGALRTPEDSHHTPWLVWVLWSSPAVLLLAAALALIFVGINRRRRARSGLAAARAYAALLAHRLGEASALSGQTSANPSDVALANDGFDPRFFETAHEISDGLTHYLELGCSRPPGALTPFEAREGVAEITGSADLGGQAERLAADCDRALYGERNGTESASGLRESGRQLFQALGRVKRSRRDGAERPRIETLDV
jgi:hypothetical protein